jgi:type VI secretion system protein VasI
MKRKYCSIPLILYIFFFSVQAVGQQEDIAYLKKRIAICAAIKGDLERLESYDQLARELGLVAKAIVLPTTGTGKWSSTSETNPVDDSTTVVLSLEADEGRSHLQAEKITLFIRCKSNKTELYIKWYDYLGDEKIAVLTRVGEAKAVGKSWGISTNNESTFYPESAIPFIKTLMSSDKFVAQVTPYNESPVTAIFDIRGLAEAIKPLQQTCGWK